MRLKSPIMPRPRPARVYGPAAAALLVLASVAAAPAATAGTAGAAAAASGPGAAAGPQAVAASGQPAAASGHYACDVPAVGRAACTAIVVGTQASAPSDKVVPLSGSAPAAAHPYMAADLQAAYKLPSALLGSRQTIAIVDAYDDPTAAADLAAYRAANGLPACDASFPCFEKVNQEGQQGNYPPPDPSGTYGWELEESLDLDMAAAICPNCKIILVEADDNTDTNLGLAVDQAAKLGANVISNSYVAPEFPGETAQDGAYYDHPGVVITAASGDMGYGVSVPAALPGVIAVGGTSLYQDHSTRGWGEDAWTGSGSGCSAYIPKPAWQHDPLCGKRTVADVSAVADPNTPVAVYDTTGDSGWTDVGGTSVAAPIIAGVYALAGNASTVNPGQRLYSHAASLNPVTSGFEGRPSSNGYCGGSYLCTSGPGYDGLTGLGTPDGIGAF